MRTEHNQPGHLNIYTLDQDDTCTAKGKHARVVAFCPGFNDGEVEYYARVDYVHGLREPSEKEVLQVGKNEMGKEMKGKWILRHRSGKYFGHSAHESEDFHFVRPK